MGSRSERPVFGLAGGFFAKELEYFNSPGGLQSQFCSPE